MRSSVYICLFTLEIFTLCVSQQSFGESIQEPSLPSTEAPSEIISVETSASNVVWFSPCSPGPLSSALVGGNKSPSLEVPIPDQRIVQPAPFSLRGGVGLSLLPLRYLFANHESVNLFQSGIGGHAFFRAHPRITLDLGISIIFTTYSTATEYWLYELPILLGMRVHLGKKPASLKTPSISPYLLLATGVNVAILLSSQQTELEQAIYFEAHAGVGVEFRVHRDFALMLDLRGIFNARFDSPTQDFFTTPSLTTKPSMSPYRVGLQVTFGVVGYF